MTFIAAFRFHGAPTLVGDFMLSWDDGNYAGLSKKVDIISDNFALAWTGSTKYASLALRHLRDNCRDKRNSLASVEQCLASIPEPDEEDSSLVIIGWVIEKHPVAFRWSSNTPFGLKTNIEPIYEGSGKNACKEVFGEIGPKVEENNLKNEVDRDEFLLSLIANLIHIEQYAPEKKNSNERFGFAFEAAVYENDHFSYISDIVFTKISVRFDHFGRVENIVQHEKQLKYAAKDSISLVLEINGNKNITHKIRSADKLASETPNFLTLQKIVRNIELSWFRVCFVFISLLSENEKEKTLVVAIHSSKNPGLIKRKNKQFLANFPNHTLEHFYRTIQSNEL